MKLQGCRERSGPPSGLPWFRQAQATFARSGSALDARPKPPSLLRAWLSSLLRSLLPSLVPGRHHDARPGLPLRLEPRPPLSFGPGFPLGPRLPRYVRPGLPPSLLRSHPPSPVGPRPPSLLRPRPPRSFPALTVAAGGWLRAERAVAGHARPQIVLANDPQRPALESPQQQHLLPLLQHVGGVARHSRREAAGGSGRRGRGLGPAPRPGRACSGKSVSEPGNDLAGAEGSRSPAQSSPACT